MQPQQPYYGPPPQQPNYDFIVNPGKPSKRLPTAGGSKLSRILIVAGGLILLIPSKLVITSEQTQLLKYMAQQHQKVSDKQLRLKVSAAVDKQLLGSVASSTYHQTLQEVMKSLLTDYATALQVAYKQSSGVNGRNLLKAEYNSAQLLQRQLATPSS
jgi:hypothetical protein